MPGSFLETDVREHLGIVRQFTSDEAPLKAALIYVKSQDLARWLLHKFTSL